MSSKRFDTILDQIRSDTDVVRQKAAELFVAQKIIQEECIEAVIAAAKQDEYIDSSWIVPQKEKLVTWLKLKSRILELFPKSYLDRIGPKNTGYSFVLGKKDASFFLQQPSRPRSRDMQRERWTLEILNRCIGPHDELVLLHVTWAKQSANSREQTLNPSVSDGDYTHYLEPDVVARGLFEQVPGNDGSSFVRLHYFPIQQSELDCRAYVRTHCSNHYGFARNGIVFLINLSKGLVFHQNESGLTPVVVYSADDSLPQWCWDDFGTWQLFDDLKGTIVCDQQVWADTLNKESGKKYAINRVVWANQKGYRAGNKFTHPFPEQQIREALPALISVLDDGDDTDRETAAWGLGCIGVHHRNLIEQLTNRLEDPNPNVRREAVGSLQEFAEQEPEIGKRVCDRLRDEDGFVRQWAAVALRYFPKADSLLKDALIEATQDQDAIVCQSAMESLARRCERDSAMIDVVASYLAHPNPLLRRAAAVAMADRGHSWNTFISTSSGETYTGPIPSRTSAEFYPNREEFGIGCGRYLSQLMDRMDDQVPFVRMYAAHAVESQVILPSDVFPRIASWTKSAFPEVRIPALRMLGAIRPVISKVKSFYRELLSGSDERLLEFALQGTARMGSEAVDFLPKINHIMDEWQTKPNGKHIVERCAVVLGCMGTAAANEAHRVIECMDSRTGFGGQELLAAVHDIGVVTPCTNIVLDRVVKRNQDPLVQVSRGISSAAAQVRRKLGIADNPQQRYADDLKLLNQQKHSLSTKSREILARYGTDEQRRLSDM